MVPGVRPGGGRLGGRDGHGGGPARRDRRRGGYGVVAFGAVGTREHHGQQPGYQEQRYGRPAPA